MVAHLRPPFAGSGQAVAQLVRQSDRVIQAGMPVSSLEIDRGLGRHPGLVPENADVAGERFSVHANRRVLNRCNPLPNGGVGRKIV